MFFNEISSTCTCTCKWQNLVVSEIKRQYIYNFIVTRHYFLVGIDLNYSEYSPGDVHCECSFTSIIIQMLLHVASVSLYTMYVHVHVHAYTDAFTCCLYLSIHVHVGW